MEESMLQVPLLIAPGNHEDMRANRDGEDIPYLFNYHINQPVTNDAINSGSYFSFDYNNIHFVLLNTEDNRQSSDNFEGGCIGFQQLDWLEEDLAAAVEKDSIVYYANPTGAVYTLPNGIGTKSYEITHSQSRLSSFAFEENFLKQ